MASTDSPYTVFNIQSRECTLISCLKARLTNRRKPLAVSVFLTNVPTSSSGLFSLPLEVKRPTSKTREKPPGDEVDQRSSSAKSSKSVAQKIFLINSDPCTGFQSSVPFRIRKCDGARNQKILPFVKR